MNSNDADEVMTKRLRISNRTYNLNMYIELQCMQKEPMAKPI